MSKFQYHYIHLSEHKFLLPLNKGLQIVKRINKLLLCKLQLRGLYVLQSFQVELSYI